MARYIQRDQLEQLMGKTALDRLPIQLQDPTDEYNKRATIQTPAEIARQLMNHKVCKSFVVDKCPYELFEGTKEDYGRCPRIHSMKYKIMFDGLKESIKKQEGAEKGEEVVEGVEEVEMIEKEYMYELKKFLSQCDRKIDIVKSRLEYDKDSIKDEEADLKMSQISQALTTADLKISLLTQEIENLIKLENKEDFEVEMTRFIISKNKELEILLLEKEDVVNKYNDLLENLNQASQQKLELCEECGGYLSRLDNDIRLGLHFIGKLHLNYSELRHSLKELQLKYGDKSTDIYN